MHYVVFPSKDIAPSASWDSSVDQMRIAISAELFLFQDDVQLRVHTVEQVSAHLLK